MDSKLTEEIRAYNRSQLIWAINLSAILGWLAISVPITSGMSGGSLLNFLGLMIWAAVIGLPIALATSWLIGAPILKRVMRSNITWIGAALWGGTIAFLIALLSIVVGRFRGWMQSIDPNTFSQMGGGDKVREVDGILTSYGWWVLAQTTFIFVLAGVVIALVVRAIIGPGRAT